MSYSRPILDDVTKAQIRTLRKQHMYVTDICSRLGLDSSSERREVRDYCHSLGNRWTPGIETQGPVSRRDRGAWR